MRQSGALVAVMLVALFVLAGGVAAAVQGPRRAAAMVLGEDALAATLQWNEVKQSAESGSLLFWPELPQFNTGLDVGPKPLAQAVANFDYVGPDSERGGAQIASTILVHPTVSGAVSDYAVVQRSVDRGGTTVSGPPIDADQWRYFSRPSGKLTEWTLRWRIGSAVGRLTAVDNKGFGARFWTPARLARMFGPVAKRVRQLLAGRLHAAPLPLSDLRLLPTASAVPGTVLGTAKMPAEAWASIDSGRDPAGVLRKLVVGGASTLVERTYLLAGVPNTAISVVLFQFKTAAAAAAWAHDFVTAVGSKGLPAGHTGTVAAFQANGGSFYELQFEHGRYVADVGCSAPFTKTPAACEAATRTLAERWYASLG